MKSFKKINTAQKIQIKGSLIGPILIVNAILPIAVFPIALRVAYGLEKSVTKKIEIN